MAQQKRKITMRSKEEQLPLPSAPPPRGLLAHTRMTKEARKEADPKVTKIEAELTASRLEASQLKERLQHVEREKELLIEVLQETQSLAVDARRDEAAASAAAFSALRDQAMAQSLSQANECQSLKERLKELQTQFEAAMYLINKQDSLLLSLRTALHQRQVTRQQHARSLKNVNGQQQPESEDNDEALPRYYLRAQDTGNRRNLDIRLCV